MGRGTAEVGLSPIRQRRSDPVHLDQVFYFLVVVPILSQGGIGCWLDATWRGLLNWWLVLEAVSLILIAGMILQQKSTLVNDPASVVAVVGAGIGLWFGPYLAVLIITLRLMGVGGVKFATILGGVVGLRSGEPVTIAIQIAVAILLATGLILLMAGATAEKWGWGDRRKAKTTSVSASMPHGPVMLVATTIVWGIGGGHLQAP